MSSNIMNQIKCASNESIAKSELQVNSNVDFVVNHELDEDTEYRSIFPARLPHESSYNSVETLINADDHIDSSHLLDDCFDRLSNSNGTEYNRSITATPADSSCGFHNTFSVLEEHLNKRPTLSQHQIEYFLWLNKEATIRNDQYIDIPITDRQYFHAVENGSADVSNDRSCEYNEPSSLFELEIEAMQWLQSTGHTKRLNESTPQKPNNASYDSQSDTYSSLVEEFYQQDEDCTDHATNANEYIYHVAKTRDGQHYIRVLRNLRLDQVLCGNRVSQMTRTYDDIEAVKLLLKEKEKDLELTAHIGKDLLNENTRLKKNVEELENDIKVANENCQQLKYDLVTKCNLLAALTNDDDEAVVEEEETIQMSLTSQNLDLLQKKISTLEYENKSLRVEATQLASQTDDIEEQERQLLIEWKDQLNSTRDENNTLLTELDRLREENKLHSETIEMLTTSLSDARLQVKQLSGAGDRQNEQLAIVTEVQNSLAMELADFKMRYQEVLTVLEDTQEELRKYRKRAQPSVRASLVPGITMHTYPPGESLHSELMESSLFSDHSLDSGIASDRGLPYNHNSAYQKAFEMSRAVNKAADNMSAQIGSMSMSSSSFSQPRMSAFPGSGSSANSKISSIYGNASYPASMGTKTYSHESLSSEGDENYPAKAPIGVPGAPGAKDLEAALKRLTPAEVLVRRTMLSNAPPGTYSYEESLNNVRNGFRTPDSIMSTGSSNLSSLSSSSAWRKKLELVVQMEGSQTLQKWSRLATPSLDGLLEDRPGIKIRGGRDLNDLGVHMYSLADVEEDAEEIKPGKQYQQSHSVYTYTTSTVMHPDDGMSMTSSVPPSQMSSRIDSFSSSRQPSMPSTPHNGLSRRNSCSTYSVSAGLASVLNERGIKAVTPSALNTPSGQNHSPTVTPLNTPEGSPTRDRSPEPPALLTGLFYSGADMIRRKLVGSSESPERTSRLTSRNKVLMARQKKRAFGSLGLMEKVENTIGLDNIIHLSANPHHNIGISPLALGSVRTRATSPMTQLTSLRNARRRDDPFAVDIETVKAVLSKGLSSDCSLSDITTDGSTTSSITSRGNSSDSAINIKRSLPTSKSANAIPSSSESNTNATASTATKTPQKLKQMQRQKSRRSLIVGGTGQRPDLGTVGQLKSQAAANANSNNNSDSKQYGSTKKTQQIALDDDDDSSSVASVAPQQTLTQSFVGSISSLFFGRKGGLL